MLGALDGVVTVEITGRIGPEELSANQAGILEHLRQWNGGTILVVCEGFEGFLSGDWTDLSFRAEADPLIPKMAIIGEKQWQDMTLAFAAKGHRPFPIEFFESGHLREANAWLKS